MHAGLTARKLTAGDNRVSLERIDTQKTCALKAFANLRSYPNKSFYSDGFMLLLLA
jgi:hypothetical protein